MSVIDLARAFLERLTDLGEGWRGHLKELPEEAQEVFWKLQKTSCFSEKNRNPKCRSEHLAPGGEYKLVVDSFSMKGSWNYTQGSIYHQSSDKPVAVVQRNYSCFPFLWVEHPNGHLYLICGEDYQGQTVIEVDTGERKDALSEGAKEGWGFCWSAHKFDPTTCLLTVDGCIWACPYEFRFYDFSNPLSGWPELEVDQGVFADSKWPEIDSDGTIRCFQSEDGDEADQPPAAILTFKREGLKLHLQEEWISDKEKASREAREEANRNYEAWLANYKTTNPLYLEFNHLVEDPLFDQKKGLGVGFTYDGWCPDWEGGEKRICRSVLKEKKDRTPSRIELEWAADTGPIKVLVFSEGSSENTFFHDHSVEGMRAAFTYIRTLL